MRKALALSNCSIAASIDLPDGRRIWIPPSGRPYWVGGANAGPDLTDAELERYGLGERKGERKTR